MKEVKRLLNAEVDKITKTYKESTPLLLAGFDEQAKAMKLLLEAGADINVKDSDGWAPLHGATEYADVMKLLLDAEANKEIRGNCSWSEVSFLDH